MSGQGCCMVMKINLDCNACCRKMRRIILRMKEIETHAIEKQDKRVIVCGRFIPAAVAIKIKKKMNRRVEILEIQELRNVEQVNAPNIQDHHTMPTSQFQAPHENHFIAQHA
ncbi:hypothetical protein ACH5RR_036147 [Cinchona calisaya]|uniref:Uncharacterized protein n=1 Tax=Cinchona calisaya TaxID=153742 RepID=A0ABD2Y3K5_9GENT